MIRLALLLLLILVPCLFGTAAATAAADKNVAALARKNADSERSLAKADLLMLYKGERRLFLMRDGRVLGSYQVALGDNPIGHKTYEGDGRTPEGDYVIDYRLEDSDFHRAIRISYPNERDRAQAAAFGKSPGGQIMIHGLPNGFSANYVGHPYEDWTEGCIAVTNAEMDEIWQRVDLGTRIVIFP